MTDTVAARPTPLSRVWSGSKIIAEDLDGGELADVLELHSDASAWWVLRRRPDEVGPQLRDVAGALDLDRVAIADLVAEDRRAKFEQLGHSRLVITNVVTVDQAAAELSVHPTSMVVTDRALICLTGDDAGGLNVPQLLARGHAVLTDGGISRALQLILGEVINTYEDAVEWLEDASDQLADALFEERPLNHDEQLRAFRLRSVLSQLRRLTDPMRMVMTELADTYADSDVGSARQWNALAEKHYRVANAADALREALSSVFDTSLALADLRMNMIMKKLTGWAAVIAVPTLVTSFVGMNVGFPLSGTVSGFWLYSTVMLAAIVVLYLVFNRKGWL
ncbi:MAG TPA: CorA family divalent cation transporter [Propionibacteriaceae bacterium]|nr:CorA family divalent cation transporter [Propionibacteriaceae bacterium]